MALFCLIVLLAAMVGACDIGALTGVDNTSVDNTSDDTSLSITNTPHASQIAAMSEDVTWLITWETNRPASSQVEYGVAETYGSLSPLDSTLVTSHTVTLSGLTPSTTYYYSVISTDDVGNKAESSYSESFRTGMQFTFVSSQVILINNSGNAALRIRFTATDPVSFKLTNPDGMLTGSGSAEKGVTGVVLNMASNHETPKAGGYTLLVDDYGGEQIATQTFDYQGANASVSDLSLTWTFSTYSQEYTLENVSFKVSNTGDLPVYIDQGECSLDGSLVTLTLYVSGAVLPGETKTISASTYASVTSAGQKTFTLTLKDSQGTVVATYTANVTPA